LYRLKTLWFFIKKTATSYRAGRVKMEIAKKKMFESGLKEKQKRIRCIKNLNKTKEKGNKEREKATKNQEKDK
jgi:hypothetical protein